MTRRLFQRYLPMELHDPLGLLGRLVRSGRKEAWFSMAAAALGVGLSPLDRLLQPVERRRTRGSALPQHPTVIVCGPPRSGTTLLAQVLIRSLRAAYLTNLAALFPRSPVTASRWVGRLQRPDSVGTTSYYGRTAGFAGPNDGIHIWERWIGSIPSLETRLDADQRAALAGFVAAYEGLYDRPFVVKNNVFNICAGEVAEALPRAHFICLWRDPLYLGQAFLRARMEIHGDASRAYGVAGEPGRGDVDVIDSVCDQVAYHERAARHYARTLGHDRFWQVSYEAFCRNPAHLVRRVATEVLGWPEDRVDLARLEPFEISRRVGLPVEMFRKLEARLASRPAAMDWSIDDEAPTE